jgi:membrane peptidoglycan carboxypeptidase
MCYHSQDSQDAWGAGYTPSLAAVVWICRSFLVTPLVLPRALPDQRVQNSFGSASTCDAAHSK